MKRHLLALLSVIASGTLFGAPKNVCAQEPCTARPAGFRVLGNTNLWDRPWALTRTRNGTRALRVFDHGWQKSPAPLPVRLDDGTRGTVSVVERECAKGEDCSPYDCGCTGVKESYWIEVHRADGRLLARKHLWAAYANFQIVAADLIDGPGDELFIARIPAHASPPTGWDLKIWRMAPQMSDVGDMPYVSRPFPTATASCAWWMAILTLDAAASKPRPISVRTEFASAACCMIIASEQLITDLRQPHALRFDVTLQRYVMTGPAPSAFTRDE